MAGDHGEPLELRDEDAIDLGYAADFHILLRAIDETMPEDAILYLEGDATATAPAVAEFLRAQEAADRREVVDNASSRTPIAFHLPLADLGQLRLLAESYASPEVAFHLAVYRGDEVILWAHDAGYGSLLLAESLPPDTVERMRSALGATLRPYPRRRRLFGLLRPRDE
jgi:hypothetical protein